MPLPPPPFDPDLALLKYSRRHCPLSDNNTHHNVAFLQQHYDEASNSAAAKLIGCRDPRAHHPPNPKFTSPAPAFHYRNVAPTVATQELDSSNPHSCRTTSNYKDASHKATDTFKRQQTTNLTEPNQCREDSAPDVTGGDGRSITNPDARTASMRERGRWGNTKQQQQPPLPKSFFHDSGATHDQQRGGQSLQHVRCLHCGSFSTTTMKPLQDHLNSYSCRSSGGGGGMSTMSSSAPHYGGRRVRDYSWQQELLGQSAKKGDRLIRPVDGVAAEVRRNDDYAFDIHHHPHQQQQHHNHHGFPDHENTCCSCGVDNVPPPPRWGMSATWQGRYMMLCQAIAAGAFDGEGSAAMAGYSYADCECESCGGGNGGFKTTKTSERMMELEAFSGPLGYVSESKAAQKQQQSSEGGSRRSWWWGKRVMMSKVEGEECCCCCACGRQVAWARAGTSSSVKLLCSDCRAAAANAGSPPGRSPRRPTPPPAFRASFPPKHHHVPRRWRLIKLCRYLLGFPGQR